MDGRMTVLLTEKDGKGVPFRIVAGTGPPDLDSRLLLLRSLLKSLSPGSVLALDSIRIEKTTMGLPVVKLSGKIGPFVSFSCSGARVWAALSWDGPVGIDAASSAEFRMPYPLQRVFAPLEWEAAGICVPAKDRAPLLWTLKEAAAKAMGCGFCGLEPIDVVNHALHRTQGIVRARIRAGRELSGLALRQDVNQWIGIAWYTKETDN